MQTTIGIARVAINVLAEAISERDPDETVEISEVGDRFTHALESLSQSRLDAIAEIINPAEAAPESPPAETPEDADAEKALSDRPRRFG